jgi:type IV pilus assembly protein PilE
MRTFNRFGSGFTLIELMIAIAVIALLASIALPSYRQHVVRSKRSAAQAVMMDLANREQQYLLANRAYADKDALIASGYVLPAEADGSYGWAVDTTSPDDGPPTFLITFTPKSGSSQAGDGALTLNEQGVKTPLDKWRR